MKKIVSLVLAAVLCLALLCPAQAQGLAAGVYTASAKGMNEGVTVQVTVDETGITAVEVVSHNETAGISDPAIARMPQAIVDAQSVLIDGVSGATLTSNAILAAVSDCIVQAGGDPAAMAPQAAKVYEKNLMVGTYQATKHGHHSDITVEVKVTADAIESVAIVAEDETSNISDTAYAILSEKIVDAQSIGVDTVAGATYTSAAVLSAVSDCLAQAGGDEAVAAFSVKVEDEPWSTEEIALETDVVVVGSGMAGICAAVAAQDKGADVIMLEKLPYYGGISQTAAGGFIYADDPNGLYEYEMNRYNSNRQGGTNGRSQYPEANIVRAYCDYSYPTLQWFEEKGMDVMTLSGYLKNWPYEKTNEDGTKETAMYHGSTAMFSVSYEGSANSIGAENGTFFDAMIAQFKQSGGQLYLETAADSLIQDETGAVVGVHATGKDGVYTIKADSVILCAGGFGASEEMIEMYAPAYMNEYNVTLPSNTGDGIRMAVEIGAAVHENQFFMGTGGQAFPETDVSMLSPYVDKDTPATAVYVNPNGQRVVNEELFCGYGAQNFTNPDSRDYYWAVINEANASASESFMAQLNEKLAAQDERFFKTETLAEMANALRIPYASLAYTMDRYNVLCENGEDTDLFKAASNMVAMEEGPWYAVKVYMNYFGTVGGLKTNEKAQVLDTEGNVIEGLYAAGENSNGGLFNLSYIGGHAIGGCATFGRIAGTHAVK